MQGWFSCVDLYRQPPEVFLKKDVHTIQRKTPVLDSQSPDLPCSLEKNIVQMDSSINFRGEFALKLQLKTPLKRQGNMGNAATIYYKTKTNLNINSY